MCFVRIIIVTMYYHSYYTYITMVTGGRKRAAHHTDAHGGAGPVHLYSRERRRHRQGRRHRRRREYVGHIVTAVKFIVKF